MSQQPSAPEADEEPSLAEPQPGLTDAGEPEAAEPQGVTRNWLGYAAFVTGALALSVVAIVLGVLGLRAASRGQADNRSFSIAGVVLGGIGVALTAIAVTLWVTGPSAAVVDARAQQDVSAVGAELATQSGGTGARPNVVVEEASYRVGDVEIPAALTGERTVEVSGHTAYTWCLELSYDGGDVEVISYRSDEGMVESGC